MAMLLMEGFEGYTTSANGLRRRYTITQSATGTLVAGRLGGYAFSPGSSVQILFMEFGNVASFVFGFAYRVSGVNINTGDIIQFIDGLTEQLVLRCTAGGDLFFDRGATNLDQSSGPALKRNQWHYIEVKAVISNTGSYEIKLDGVTIMSDAGPVDTQGTANSYITRIDTNQNSTTDQQYDDIYFLDLTGLTNNDFLGDVQIQTLYPDADGNRNDMTPLSGLTNYEMVDEGQTPDDDTTYNSGGVVGNDELYSHDALTGTFDTVYAVQVRNLVRKEEAGYRTGATLVRSNTDELEGTPHPVATDYRYYDHIYEVDPQGGGAWTEARVNAAEFGFTVKT